MAHYIQLPQVLLSLSSNPVTAVGLPVIAGMLSGLPTRKVVRGQWYNVSRSLLHNRETGLLDFLL
jgi:translocator protein